jgi:hypothetical protein
MALPLQMPFSPMEGLSVDAIPVGKEWQYEPKWDGFRALAFRDGKNVDLQSKSARSMKRYFPEVVAALRRLDALRFVLDGELVGRGTAPSPSTHSCSASTRPRAECVSSEWKRRLFSSSSTFWSTPKATI